jgi:UDPglucose 6-dehydrogenase
MAEGARVVGYDPLAMENIKSFLPTMEYAADSDEALRGADACVLVTEWDEFLSMDWSKKKDSMAYPLVIDGRNALDGQAMRQLGFIYEGVGKKPLV